MGLISKLKHVRSCVIFEEVDFPNIGRQDVWYIIHCFPFDNANGGMVRAYSSMYGGRQERVEYKQLLYRLYEEVIEDVLTKRPNSKVIYYGLFGRDGKHESGRFE